MKSLKLILEHTNAKSTIVAEFTPSKKTDSSYQSEAVLEKEFIAKLQSQGYEYAKITNEADLESNLRLKLQELNSITLSDTEWKNFLTKF